MAPNRAFQATTGCCGCPWDLGPLPADSACKLDVLGHDGDPPGVDSTQVGVLKEPHPVGLAGLQCHHCRALEVKISLEVLSNLRYQALAWELADQQLSGFLRAANLTWCHGARSVVIRRLYTPCG